MTNMNKDDAEKNAAEEARIKRRSILKAGAVIAPLALTLHGGIPLAQAMSTDCLQELHENLLIPNFVPNYDDDHHDDGHDDHHTGYILDPNKPPTPFDPYNQLTTGRQFEGEDPETHWDYLIREDLYGVSCLTSVVNTGLTVNL